MEEINKYSGGVAEQCGQEMKMRVKGFGKSNHLFRSGPSRK
jgi:hypothetical protein